MAEEPTGSATEEEGDYPENWRFDEDGAEVRGKFVKFDVGQTQEYGECPIVVLNVDGEERSVWLFHTAIRSKFQKEVNRREIQPGEQINIKQAGEKMGGNKRSYMNYIVAFVDAPPLDAKALFGAVSEAADPEDDVPESKDW
jgi:hypothetical protein